VNHSTYARSDSLLARAATYGKVARADRSVEYDYTRRTGGSGTARHCWCIWAWEPRAVSLARRRSR
jgi:hypothetical protein